MYSQQQAGAILYFELKVSGIKLHLILKYKERRAGVRTSKSLPNNHYRYINMQM